MVLHAPKTRFPVNRFAPLDFTPLRPLETCQPQSYKSRAIKKGWLLQHPCRTNHNSTEAIY